MSPRAPGPPSGSRSPARTLKVWLKTDHPVGLGAIYSSYLVGMDGYLLENPSVRNVILFAVAIGFQIARISAEESCLSHDPAYKAYRARVRYRLGPFVY